MSEVCNYPELEMNITGITVNLSSLHLRITLVIREPWNNQRFEWACGIFAGMILVVILTILCVFSGRKTRESALKAEDQKSQRSHQRSNKFGRTPLAARRGLKGLREV